MGGTCIYIIGYKIHGRNHQPQCTHDLPPTTKVFCSIFVDDLLNTLFQDIYYHLTTATIYGCPCSVYQPMEVRTEARQNIKILVPVLNPETSLTGTPLHGKAMCSVTTAKFLCFQHHCILHQSLSYHHPPNLPPPLQTPIPIKLSLCAHLHTPQSDCLIYTTILCLSTVAQ